MDTDSNLSALFQDSNTEDPSSSDNSRVDIAITVKALVSAEVTGTFLGEYSANINAIWDNTRCIEIDMEANTRVDHHIITMRVPAMNVAHQMENIIAKVVWVHEEGDLE